MASQFPVWRAARAVFFPSALELLEDRAMFATVNVADFGARPNDGVSDLSATQAAINASKPGDTILFDGGVFDFGSSDLTIAGGGRTYLGTNGAASRGHGAAGQLLTLHESGATLTGLTFDGGGIFMDSRSGMNQNIVIDNNVFKLNTSGANPNGITFTSGLQNARITNNYFSGYTGTFAMYGYNYNNLVIANNEMVNVNAGMHIDAFSNSGNLLVEQNYISGAKGVGMEFQSTANNLVFQDNWFENPNLSTDRTKNNNSMAFSLILDKSNNVTIRCNTVIAPQRPDGIGCRIGFEVGGDNTVIEDNYVNGINNVLAVNDGVGTASVLVQNNRFMNYLEGPRLSFPAVGRVWQTINNGPNVRLSDMMEARIAANAKPGIGDKRYGTETQTQTEAPSTPDVPGGLNLVLGQAGTAVLSWAGAGTSDSVGYAVSFTVDGTNWNDLDFVNGLNYAISGLQAGLTYSFRVRAFNDIGASVDSAPVTLSIPTPPPPSQDATYLSDMAWTVMKNAWGQAERDESNGEKGTSDGKTITLNGATYTKGLGVHAGSEIHFRLDGKYSKFLSDIGIDDEVGNRGSAVFQVYADGVKIYDSGVMTGAGATKSLSLDVTGRQELVLIVDSNGSQDFDHSDWAGARLVPASTTSVQSSALTELTPLSQSNGWGNIEINSSNGEKAVGDGRAITLNGKTYVMGIGVHAESKLVYDLGGQYSTFMTDMGMDDEVGSLGSVVFQILVDGQKVFDSGLMTGASPTQTATVDIQGKNQLTLVVDDAGDGMNFDHADWANPQLIS